jgi:hypothetical protein
MAGLLEGVEHASGRPREGPAASEVMVVLVLQTYDLW